MPKRAIFFVQKKPDKKEAILPSKFLLSFSNLHNNYTQTFIHIYNIYLLHTSYGSCLLFDPPPGGRVVVGGGEVRTLGGGGEGWVLWEAGGVEHFQPPRGVVGFWGG